MHKQVHTLCNSCGGTVKVNVNRHTGSTQLAIQFMGGTMPFGNNVRQRCGNWYDYWCGNWCGDDTAIGAATGTTSGAATGAATNATSDATFRTTARAITMRRLLRSTMRRLPQRLMRQRSVRRPIQHSARQYNIYNQRRQLFSVLRCWFVEDNDASVSDVPRGCFYMRR